MFFRILSPYHKTILFIYIALITITGMFYGRSLDYSPVINNHALIIFILAQVILLVFIFFKNRNFSRVEKINLNNLWLAMSYGFIFAIPEEILFRGVIQGVFLSSLDTYMAVFISSVIFGLAHVFNDSKSFKIQDWNFKLAGLAFLGGLPLGYIFTLTQSLFLPTILHAMFLFWLQIFDQNFASKYEVR